MYEAGLAADADVVLGRPASDFRGLNHSIYRRTIPSCVLTDFPDLTETLTPHKMFRREFLLEHGIRFPEGPVPLEDQMFVMRAYLHAKAISVLSDRPYYFYLRRIGSGRNAGDRRIDPVLQCAATEQVIDIVEGWSTTRRCVTGCCAASTASTCWPAWPSSPSSTPTTSGGARWSPRSDGSSRLASPRKHAQVPVRPTASRPAWSSPTIWWRWPRSPSTIARSRCAPP